MNMLSAMLWAWIGVSLVSGAAAALVVLGEVRAPSLPVLRDGERPRMCVPVPGSGPMPDSSAAGAHDGGSSP